MRIRPPPPPPQLQHRFSIFMVYRCQRRLTFGKTTRTAMTGWKMISSQIYIKLLQPRIRKTCRRYEPFRLWNHCLLPTRTMFVVRIAVILWNSNCVTLLAKWRHSGGVACIPKRKPPISANGVDAETALLRWPLKPIADLACPKTATITALTFYSHWTIPDTFIQDTSKYIYICLYPPLAL